MQLNSSFDRFNHHQPTPKFGWNMGVDVGVSIGPNAKLSLYDDDWKKVSESKRSHVLLPLPMDPPKQTETLLHNLAKLMNKKLHRLPAKSSPMLSHEGKNLVFFMPGQQNDNIIPSIHHVPSRVRNIDLNKIPELMTSSSTRKALQPVTKFAKDVRIITLNDVMGGMAVSMKELARKYPEKFKSGMEVMFLMSGGGLGVGNAQFLADKHDEGFVRLEASELGHVPLGIRNGIDTFGISSGGKISGLLKAFTEELPEHVSSILRENIRKSANGPLVTHYDLARRYIPGLTLKEHEKAAKKACQEHLKVLAAMTQVKLCLGGNLAILTGSVTDGIRCYVNTHPNLFKRELKTFQSIPFTNPMYKGRSIFDCVFVGTLWNQLGLNRNHQQADFLQNLFLNKKFDIISDITIKDNTEGTPYIAKGWYEKGQNRFVIPASVFKL